MQTHPFSVQSSIPHLILTEHSDRLFCSRCALNSIPLPTGATPRTTFTCKSCCAQLLRSRDAQVAAAIAAQIDESFAGLRGEISNGRSL